MAVKRSAKKAKKATVKRAVKRTAKKPVKGAWATPPKPATITTIPSRYGTDPKTGLITPKATQAPIKASKLKRGLEEARKLIDSTIADIMAPSDDYDIKSIEFSLTFGVKGEFVGFGGSGATTVKLTIGPPSKVQEG